MVLRRLYLDPGVYDDDETRRIGVAPSRAFRARILSHQVTLEELFVSGRNERIPGAHLERMRARARYRIVQAFASAVDERQHPTDNFITGSFSAGYPRRWAPVGDSLDELWRAVCRITRRCAPWCSPITCRNPTDRSRITGETPCVSRQATYWAYRNSRSFWRTSGARRMVGKTMPSAPCGTTLVTVLGRLASR